MENRKAAIELNELLPGSETELATLKENLKRQIGFCEGLWIVLQSTNSPLAGNNIKEIIASLQELYDTFDIARDNVSSPEEKALINSLVRDITSLLRKDQSSSELFKCIGVDVNYQSLNTLFLSRAPSSKHRNKMLNMDMAMRLAASVFLVTLFIFAVLLISVLVAGTIASMPLGLPIFMGTLLTVSAVCGFAARRESQKAGKKWRQLKKEEDKSPDRVFANLAKDVADRIIGGRVQGTLFLPPLMSNPLGCSEEPNMRPTIEVVS
ncbi:MAG TPA: hypothetical protein VNC84_00420 [Gammaproteobacteria bacterium]|jgi:hypothetical protein|nr:hypothetical protein [Gammaproteobacteria bacterium]